MGKWNVCQHHARISLTIAIIVLASITASGGDAPVYPRQISSGTTIFFLGATGTITIPEGCNNALFANCGSETVWLMVGNQATVSRGIPVVASFTHFDEVFAGEVFSWSSSDTASVSVSLGGNQ